MALGLEAAAVNVLKRAVELDENRRYTEAMVCYQEGIQILLDYMKIIGDGEKKKHYRSKIESYMSRAEVLKKQIEEDKLQGVYHEQILIEHNSRGHSYQSVFERFLDADVKEVWVEDPYIQRFHQCQNLLRFCEVLVKKCPNLRVVRLLTTEDKDGKNAPKDNQEEWLRALSRELGKHQITFTYTYSPTLHDRQIRLNNGWIIKIGRGLDYFKAPDNKFSIGNYDLDLRLCHETTVDVFHEKDVRTSS